MNSESTHIAQILVGGGGKAESAVEISTYETHRIFLDAFLNHSTIS